MQAVDLSKYNNNNYNPGNKLKILMWYFFSRIFINTSIPYPYGIKRFVLRLFGAKIASGVVLKQNINIKYPWFLTIEENAWIGENAWIDNLADVKIGANACISQGAMLLTGNHQIKLTTFDLLLGPITLEAGSWVGAQSIVCPGVTLRSHSLLTVGSVATSDLKPFGIYQGNPAVWKKERVIK